MNIIIRKAIVEDYFSIYELNKNDLGYDYSPEKQKEKLKKVLADNKQEVFVACCNNQVIGYIHIADYSDVLYADNYKNILGIAVNQQYQKNGAGSALLSAAEGFAKESGAVGIRLSSGFERTEAHKFYLSNGYSEKKSQKKFIKELN